MHCGDHVQIREDASASLLASRQMSDAVNRAHLRVRQLIALSSLMALSLSFAPADAEVFKCVGAGGKTSYRANPCQKAAEETLKVQAPAPPASTGARQSPDAPAATPSATAPRAHPVRPP